MSEAIVLFEELSTINSKKIGLITINAEQTLNSLSLDMVDLIQPKLSEWETNDIISCVFLQSAGQKAFCAGGDVRQLYDSIVEADGGDNPYALGFFQREYTLNHHIHSYKKPFIVWASGICFGGGIGLTAGGSHRIVTETTRMAMPEISIGLYPDVGGSWFLNKAPGNTGLFMGLTGAQINGNDALEVGLGDHFINSSQQQQVITALQKIAFSDDEVKIKSQISAALKNFEQQAEADKPAGNIATYRNLIEEVTGKDSLSEIINAILAIESDDKFLQIAVKNVSQGCATSFALVQQQILRAKNMSLAEVFQMELIMSLNCARYGNFQEGVRALLVDKDRNPSYQPATLIELSQEFVEQHFAAPWGAAPNPLAHL
jgi:enoyl-CoA hydratase/carnithine racemase